MCFRCRKALPRYVYYFNGMVFCSGVHKECRTEEDQTPKSMCGKPNVEEVKRMETYIVEMSFNFVKTFNRYNMSDSIAARICPGRDPKSTRRLLTTICKRLVFEPWRFVPPDGEDMLDYKRIKTELG